MRAAWVIAVVLAAAGARADTFKSAKNYLQLELPTGVAPSGSPTPAAEATLLVATFHGPRVHAAITRIGVPNPRAWRKDKKFFVEVEAGLAKHTPGYRKLRSKRHKLGKVPALDLDFRRIGSKGPERVVARFLFFRTFSVTLMAATGEGAPRTARDAALKLRKTFKPYFKK